MARGFQMDIINVDIVVSPVVDLLLDSEYELIAKTHFNDNFFRAAIYNFFLKHHAFFALKYVSRSSQNRLKIRRALAQGVSR